MIGISVSGFKFPKNVPLTLASLRRALSGITFVLTGSITTSDLVDGSVTPAKVAQVPFAYDDAATYAAKTYTITLSPALPQLASGMRCWFKSSVDVEDGPITAVVNGLPAKPLLRADLTNLVKGDILQNAVVELVYAAGVGGGAWIVQTARTPAPILLTTAGTLTAYTVDSSLGATVPVRWKSFAALAGQPLLVKVHILSGASPTLNVDGLGAKPIKSKALAVLGAAELISNQIIQVVYDSVADAFIILGDHLQQQMWFGVATAAVANAYKVTLAGFPAAYQPGMLVAFQAPSRNSSGATLEVNANGAISITKWPAIALAVDDIQPNSIVTVMYDGTNWQWVGASPYLMQDANLGAAAGSTAIAHGIAGNRAPRYVHVVLRCTSADNGYAVDDEVSVESVLDGGSNLPAFVTMANRTQINVYQSVIHTNIGMRNKGTGVYTALAGNSKWGLRIYYAP